MPAARIASARGIAELVDAAVRLTLVAEDSLDGSQCRGRRPLGLVGRGLERHGRLALLERKTQGSCQLHASPWPSTCIYIVAGCARSRWLCRAVISMPLSARRLMTGPTSASVKTRSPMTMVWSLISWKASQEPSASAGLIAIPSSVTLRSGRGRLKRCTPPGCSGARPAEDLLDNLPVRCGARRYSQGPNEHGNAKQRGSSDHVWFLRNGVSCSSQSGGGRHCCASPPTTSG